MTDMAKTERRELADALLSVGPDAPTLCDGWDAGDLAAHLWLRENDGVAAAGILVGPLANQTTDRMKKLRNERTFDQIVESFATGPKKKLSPFQLPAVDRTANSFEYFVHHEDVRRAGARWTPRVLPADQDQWLWDNDVKLARRVLRKAPAGVVLVRVQAGEQTASEAVALGPDPVHVIGEAGELALWLYGRGSHARVEFDGPKADAVQAISQLKPL